MFRYLILGGIAVMKVLGKAFSLVILIAALESMLLVSEGAGANTIVQFDIMGLNGPNGPASSFQVELFDTQTPVTVTNFLSYVNNNAYDNSIIHRNIADFVVQGGGINLAGTNSEASPNPSPISPITRNPPIVNEPGISNVRGTIGMARTQDPNSATSQWYFNVSDNTFLDDPNNSSNAFTVFGRVLGSGMSVVDAINHIGTYDISSYYSPTANVGFQTVPLFQDNNNSRYFITVSSINVVPEPCTLTLLCMCSVSLFAYAWRRHKASM
jgi:cyclophilin family peptidyl-prolyl cis-trans isomerase